MKTALDSRLALRWLAGKLVRPCWSQAQRVVVGGLGRRLVRARSFDYGLTVAMTLERPTRHAAQVCLLLAATPEACDDALYLADARLWLLRRYPAALNELELELLLKQQLALAALLASRERNQAVSLPIAGSYA